MLSEKLALQETLVGVNSCIALRNGGAILKEELEPPSRGDSLKNYSTTIPGNSLQQSQKETGTHVSEKIIPQVRSKPLKSMWRVTSFGTENMRFCV